MSEPVFSRGARWQEHCFGRTGVYVSVGDHWQLLNFSGVQFPCLIPAFSLWDGDENK